MDARLIALEQTKGKTFGELFCTATAAGIGAVV